MSSRGRLCLHAPYLYPLWSEGRVAFTGGAEVQQALLARGLLARGFEVVVVTCDYGQPHRTTAHGITLLSTFPPTGGVPVLRFFHPRLTRTVGALLEARADAYYARGSGLPAGVACDVARLRGAAFVLGAAHDHDARASLPLQSNPRDRWWYRRALRAADAVVAQTEHQRGLFRDEFGRESVVIPNLVELPAAPTDPGAAGPVVWLATYKPSKRPEWFLELARRMPEQRFVMCGVIPIPPDTLDAWQAAEAAARRCPNLEVRGFVDHERLGDLFRGAALFVHTSPAEGFPNTVLEAWAHGLPTVTAVDPDGVVARERLGAVVPDLDALTAAVRRLLGEPAFRREAGARAREYVASRHSPDAVLDRLAEVFDRVIAARSARDRR